MGGSVSQRLALRDPTGEPKKYADSCAPNTRASTCPQSAPWDAGWHSSASHAKRPRRARRGPAVPQPGLTQAQRAQPVWTLDFKGWFLTADGQRQEPLTVRDSKSRYLLDIRLLPNQSDPSVRQALTRLFRREGLPTAIRVDNGSPFAGIGALGLSRLSVWWLRLGIRVEFTRRARPGDNAAHEQMHSRYKAETLQAPAAKRTAQQRRSDRWRKDYNEHRPQEGLGLRTPASGYARSKRALPRTLPPLHYKPGQILRTVRTRGHIKWQGKLCFLGRAFVGEQVCLKAVGTTHHAGHRGTLRSGEIQPKDSAGMRPAHWSRHPTSPLKV